MPVLYLQFESGSSALQQSYMDNIQKLYRYLKNNDKNIEIIGHTDSIGSGENNLAFGSKSRYG